MSEPSFWLVLAGLLLVAEMLTGTFYLLLIGVGASLGALAAWLGAGLELQIGAAAAFSAVATVVLYQQRKIRTNADGPATHDLLDAGNVVHVHAWGGEDLAPSQTRVSYRGAQWSAISIDAQPSTGAHRIVRVNGSTLELQRVS